MALGRGDVPQAVQSELLKLWPAAVDKVVPANYNQVFNVVTDERAYIRLASVHAAARFQQFGSGTPMPNRDPFQGAQILITPIMLGEMRSFQFQTIEEVKAAIGTDLVQACDNWAMAQENTRDLQCVQALESTANGYDSVSLFNAAHYQQSRYSAGPTFSNIGTAGSINHAFIRDFVSLMEDTNAVSEAGDKIDCTMTHICVTGRAQWFELIPVLRSQQRAGTANNDVNVLEQLGLTPMLWRNLDEATQKIYGFSFMPAAGGLIYVNKQNTMIETQRNFQTKMTEATAHLQGIASYSDWRRVVRAQLVAAQ